MNDVAITTNKSLNMEALDAALRTALGTKVSGFSVGGGQVIVHMDDSATPAQIQQAQQIVADHNASGLTPTQQAEQERQQALEQMRQTAGNLELQTSDYNGQPQAIQNLAQKVMWLEQELRELQRRLGTV